MNICIPRRIARDGRHGPQCPRVLAANLRRALPPLLALASLLLVSLCAHKNALASDVSETRSPSSLEFIGRGPVWLASDAESLYVCWQAPLEPHQSLDCFVPVEGSHLLWGDSSLESWRARIESPSSLLISPDGQQALRVRASGSSFELVDLQGHEALQALHPTPCSDFGNVPRAVAHLQDGSQQRSRSPSSSLPSTLPRAFRELEWAHVPCTVPSCAWSNAGRQPRTRKAAAMGTKLNLWASAGLTRDRELDELRRSNAMEFTGSVGAELRFDFALATRRRRDAQLARERRKLDLPSPDPQASFFDAERDALRRLLCPNAGSEQG